MIKYIFRRLIQVAITVWIIATITFLAIRLAPGDPASVMIGQIGTVYEYESVSKQLGLDRPLYIQYLEYIGGIIIGDLGDSMYFKKSNSVRNSHFLNDSASVGRFWTGSDWIMFRYT